jgi:uncharacterized protein (TIGR04255 family)
MATPRPLAHAPVIEALIDFRVHIPENENANGIDEALDKHEFGYQKIGPILRGNFGLFVNPQTLPIPQTAVGETTVIGTRLHSGDGKYVAQFSTEGFSLSRLAPYESWEALINEAKQVWEVYRLCLKPNRIHRTACRFINNLRLPISSGGRFERFLTGLPSMPADFPQSVMSFLQRFVIYDEQTGATAILTQALDQITTSGPLPVILDIDVFRETQFSCDSLDVWDYLTELRTLKNRYFFGLLTDAALELYA